MRKIDDAIDTLLDAHVEIANAANSPETAEIINNLRGDLHLLVKDIIKAARGEASDLEV